MAGVESAADVYADAAKAVAESNKTETWQQTTTGAALAAAWDNLAGVMSQGTANVVAQLSALNNDGL